VRIPSTALSCAVGNSRNVYRLLVADLTRCFYREVEVVMKKRIHVNQHAIKKNRKTGSKDPVVTVKTYKSNEYAHEVIIHGPSKVIYSPDKPLSCGAHVWVETEAEVELIRHDERADVV